MELAKRSRGTPRIANRLLKRVRDFAQVMGNGTVEEQAEALKTAAALFAEDCKSPPASAHASHWQSKKVAFLGDSITDKIHVGTKKNYWQYLSETMGIVPYVYAVNGNTFKDILTRTTIIDR